MSEPWRERVEVGDAVLYLGRCEDVLPAIERFDAVVSDPPYGIASSQSGSRCGGAWAYRSDWRVLGDDQPFDPEPWLGAADVLLWGANHFAHRLPHSPGWLVWDKKLGIKEDDFSDGEAAWHKRGTRLRIYRQLWNGLLAHERGERRQHISQKPVALMEWCLSFVRGDTILDPYMGSGTTGVACANLGRRFIGIELDPKHFATAVRRITETQRQGRLFDPPRQRAEQLALLPDAAP